MAEAGGQRAEDSGVAHAEQTGDEPRGAAWGMAGRGTRTVRAGGSASDEGGHGIASGRGFGERGAGGHADTDEASGPLGGDREGGDRENEQAVELVPRDPARSRSEFVVVVCVREAVEGGDIEKSGRGKPRRCDENRVHVKLASRQ